ncbi:MAG: hypothetical protein H6944_02010 [Zoogloeaceae bacterium]|uniref:hypothetical protein n=1 Tax=Denitromonas sp. TaxID=2734609 RepID=UPI001D3E329B|nr:hypothetical protein [Rhodocyclaceae bacterium]MCP5220445.1 hypothetical protein [Zoogloeaceae bacterium]HPR07754.1 hypothetical protein [Denitromonas sp.]
MTRFFQLSLALIVALSAAPALALSSARAGGNDASNDRPAQTQPDRNCARYQSAIAKLDARIAREADRSRAQRLRESKQRYQQRVQDGGCNRSLR